MPDIADLVDLDLVAEDCGLTVNQVRDLSAQQREILTRWLRKDAVVAMWEAVFGEEGDPLTEAVKRFSFSPDSRVRDFVPRGRARGELLGGREVYFEGDVIDLLVKRAGVARKEATRFVASYWLSILDAIDEGQDVWVELRRYYKEAAFDAWLAKNLRVLKKYDLDVTLFASQHRFSDKSRADLVCRFRDGSGWLIIENKRATARRWAYDQISHYLKMAKKDLAKPGDRVEGLVLSNGTDVEFRSAVKRNPRVRHLNIDDVDSRLADTLG